MSQLRLSPVLSKIPGNHLKGITIALVIGNTSGEEMRSLSADPRWLYIDATLGDRVRFPVFEELVVFVTIDRSKSPRAREKIAELVTSVLPGLMASRHLRLCVKMYVRF
jgi:hypothetical protein